MYNLGLEAKTFAYSSHKKSISKYDLIKQLPELRKEFDYIKECPSQVLQYSIITLDTAYLNFFKGKNLVVIGRFQPSSKVCSTCGNHKKDLKLSDRTYNCDACGNSIDRDANAAYNIKNFGVRDNPLYANVSH